MMNAIIFETPIPDPRQVRSIDESTRCGKQLRSTDEDYFRRRAVQEVEAARDATCCEARIAHEKLAAAYRHLWSSNMVQADSDLASGSPMFRFNPRSVD